MLVVGSKNSLPSRVRFDESQLISLVSSAFGGKKVKNSELLPYSSSNKTLKVTFDDDTGVIVKVSIRESRFDRIAMESNLIKLLASKTELPLPKILYTDFTRSVFQYPFVVYSFVSGTNLVDAITNINDKRKIGVELAHIARQIHQIEFEFPQFSLAKGTKSDNWRILIQGVCDTGLVTLFEQGYQNIAFIKKYIETKMRLLEEPSAYKLIHRDLQPQNIHWDLENNKISGIFDFEAAMSGDSLFEFAFLEMRLFKEYSEIRSSFYNTYSKYLPLRTDFEQIIKFYEVVRDLIYYPRNISYGEIDRAEAALKSMEKIVFED